MAVHRRAATPFGRLCPAMTRERLERATRGDSVARARRDENEPGASLFTSAYLHPFPPGGLALALALTLALALSLPLPLVGVVAAIEAAGGSAEHAMMAGIMTGDTADDGALDAALGVGGRCRGQNKCGGG